MVIFTIKFLVMRIIKDKKDTVKIYESTKKEKLSRTGMEK